LRIAVMQPYFFPYIGYYQLMAAVDHFVLLDDVNFIKRGFVNRNEILLNGKRHRITLELSNASQNRKINEIAIGTNGSKLLETIRHAYAHARYFALVYEAVAESLSNAGPLLIDVLEASIRKTSGLFGISTEISRSSRLGVDKDVRGEARIIKICNALDGNEYVNPPGGRGLYHRGSFEKHGIRLFFLEPHLEPYAQQSENFVPGLSVIDVLMNCGIEARARLLRGAEEKEGDYE
jgi:hypothetical protein